MTWYAHAIYAPWSEGLAQDLNGTFSGFMYHVKSLEKCDWWTPEIKHGLPPGGLLAIQPVGSGEGHAFESWHQKPFFDWVQIPQVSARVDGLPGNLLDQEDGPEGTPVPSRFLDYLAHQSEKWNVPLFYYQSFMWGGDTEEEFAWVFECGRELVYKSVFDKPPSRIVKHAPGQPPVTADGEVFRLALGHLGLELPTSYFALHTRSFDWARHRF